MSDQGFISEEEISEIMLLSEEDTKRELIGQIRFGRQCLIDNFAEKRELRKENKKLTNTLETGADTLNYAISLHKTVGKDVNFVLMSIAMWRNTSYILFILVIILCARLYWLGA
jgi:hypothetical protein